MKLLKFTLALALSLYYIPGFAANLTTSVDTTPPDAEGALTAEQTPPLSSAQSQAPVNNNPDASAPSATPMPSDTPIQTPSDTNQNSLPMPHDGHGPVQITPPQSQSPTTNSDSLIQEKNMSSMNTTKSIPTRAEVDNDLSP